MRACCVFSKRLAFSVYSAPSRLLFIIWRRKLKEERLPLANSRGVYRTRHEAEREREKEDRNQLNGGMLTIYSRPWLDCFPSLRICLFFSFFFFFVVALHSNYWEKMSPVIFTLSSDPLIKEAFFVFLFFFSYSSSNLRLYSIPCCGWLFSSSSICTSPFKKKTNRRKRGIATAYMAWGSLGFVFSLPLSHWLSKPNQNKEKW